MSTRQMLVIRILLLVARMIAEDSAEQREIQNLANAIQAKAPS